MNTIGEVSFRDSTGRLLAICGPERVRLLRAAILGEGSLPPGVVMVGQTGGSGYAPITPADVSPSDVDYYLRTDRGSPRKD